MESRNFLYCLAARHCLVVLPDSGTPKSPLIFQDKNISASMQKRILVLLVRYDPRKLGPGWFYSWKKRSGYSKVERLLHKFLSSLRFVFRSFNRSETTPAALYTVRIAIGRYSFLSLRFFTHTSSAIMKLMTLRKCQLSMKLTFPFLLRMLISSRTVLLRAGLKGRQFGCGPLPRVSK